MRGVPGRVLSWRRSIQDVARCRGDVCLGAHALGNASFLGLSSFRSFYGLGRIAGTHALSERMLAQLNVAIGESYGSGYW